MTPSLQQLLDNLPYEILFDDIPEFETFEDRFFLVEAVFGDILGMNVGSCEFAPNHHPPLLQTEILPWLWVIRPQLSSEILNFANKDLRKIIEEYPAS